MNPDLQKQLAEMLAKLAGTAGDVATFAKDQIPPLVQEKITFGRAWETADLLMAVALLAFIGYLAYRSWQEASDDDYDNPGWIIGGCLSTIGVVVMFFAVASSLESFLMVWFAPRLYVVEWLKAMVTK